MDAVAGKGAKPGFSLDAFLPYRLSLLSNTVSGGISKAYRGRFGLSVTQWRVVAVLGSSPDLTASDITRRTGMDKVAVSRAVQRLRNEGYIERRAAASDRRRQRLRLTGNKGVTLFRTVVPRALEYERRLQEAFDAEERATFDHLLARLQEAAEALNRG